MEKGKSGEKYILGGINISYSEFFKCVRSLSFCRGRIIKLSKNTIKGWALFQKLKYKVTGSYPRFDIKAIDYIFWNYTFSSEKAVTELGYRITSLEEGMKITINHLKKQIA